MVEIVNPNLSVRRITGTPHWEVRVDYVARFAPNELNVTFTDAIKIWEWDGDIGSSEVLHPYEGTHENFIATALEMPRHKVRHSNTDSLDEEIGTEQIRAQVWLGNSPVPPGNRAEVFTSIFHIDVDP